MNAQLPLCLSIGREMTESRGFSAVERLALMLGEYSLVLKPHVHNGLCSHVDLGAMQTPTWPEKR